MSNDKRLMPEIQKLSANQYALYYHPKDGRNSLDGHTWSKLIQAYCSANSIPLKNVTHDPESDMYSATSSKIESLEKLVKVIDELTSSSDLYMEWVSIVDEEDDHSDDDDMTTEEYLNMLDEAGYDMTAPMTFRFLLDNVKDAVHAKTIQSEIEKRGYTTNIEAEADEEVFFEIKLRIEPLLKEVLEIESFLKTVALQFGAKYIGY